MALKIEVSEVVDRPVDKVFHFVVDEHVRNHPRWDPDIKLEKITEGPMRVGTLIRRTNSRSGKPVEGTMEVVEFERNRAVGMVVHDGPVETRSRMLFEAVGDKQTKMSTYLDIPSLDESVKDFLLSRLQRSSQNRRQLIETEIEA